MTLKDPLLNLLVILLAPLFLTDPANLDMARYAALQTIESYKAETRSDLVTIAQIIAFGLAALGSLGLSMDNDLSVSGILKLRNSATALSRAGERHRKILDNDRREREIERALAESTHQNQQNQHDEQQHEEEARATIKQARDLAAKTPKPTTKEAETKLMWATSYTNVAEQTLADLPNIPPAERPYATIRANALSSTAVEIFTELNAQPRAP